MTRTRYAAALALAGVCLGACNNGGGQSPAPSPVPAPGSQNPCPATSVRTGYSAPASGPGAAGAKRTAVDGSNRWRVLDSLWTHREASARQAPLTSGTTTATADVGEIAVLQDAGDLILLPNRFDLRDTGLRFTRSGSAGYDVQRVDGAFRMTLGNRLTLEDDDSVPADVPFSFPFYGVAQTRAFINSDGNITFEAADQASTERNITRLLTGPPRVAPFLADLDPSTGGGVFVHAAADQYTVTWCNVRGFDSQRTTTVQATLLPDGAIEFKLGQINLQDAIVGISPGRTADFRPVDLSASGPTAGGGGAVGERFSEAGQLDTVAVTRKFYEAHPDNYDQLVIWTDTPLTREAFAYEVTVANEIRGIGLDVFDISRDFGSGGRLRSLAVMDWLGKYPADPAQKFLGENSTLSVLGQEVGHRWLAFLRFRNHRGETSDALLGRDLSHWSFFFDSDASVMEGNDIEDLGGGSFRTVGAVSRFSLLDQYAMGIVREQDVPPFFYVENPVNPQPVTDRNASPQVGVTFAGTRRDVLIQDIVAVHGARVPSADESPRVHRQAFIYVASRTADAADIEKVDRIRRQWESFFLGATDGRMRAETRLR